jgi:hypothetical protein
MNKITLIISLFFLSFFNLQAQNNNQKLSQEQVQILVQKMMNYYEQYDNGAPESVKKAKFNEYVDEVNPNLSKADREKAYVIVNAYIMADKGQSPNLKISDEKAAELQKMLQNAKDKQQQGLEAMYQKVAKIKQMSYSEYRDYVTQNGQVYMDENQIRKAYNEMHKDDNKRVAMQKETSSVKINNAVQAIDIVKHPEKHTFAEFKAAMKFLKPNVTDEEINKVWEHRKKR